MHSDCTHYLIHDNYARPFCVYIDENHNQVHIYKKEYRECYQNDELEDYTKFIGTYSPSKIFIGESPLNSMTEFSAGHGPEFDGNSILLKMEQDKYIFIGDHIYSFKTEYEIVEFVSPVGNNDVPYPYAIDDNGNYYFLLGDEPGILRLDKEEDKEDPYSYYFEIIKGISMSENVECIYINDERYCLRSYENPSKNYDDLIKRLGSPMYIQFKGEDEDKKIISKEEYVELMERYNKKIGLTPLKDVNIIVKRDW
jgi:hypothetical protein